MYSSAVMSLQYSVYIMPLQERAILPCHYSTIYAITTIYISYAPNIYIVVLDNPMCGYRIRLLFYGRHDIM